jgi:hypothetical protein
MKILPKLDLALPWAELHTHHQPPDWFKIHAQVFDCLRIPLVERLWDDGFHGGNWILRLSFWAVRINQ